MVDARRFGSWTGRVFRRKGARILAVVAAVLLIAFIMSLTMNNGARHATPELTPAQAAALKEAQTRAAAERQRQLDAERQREIERVEAERKQEAERQLEAQRALDRMREAAVRRSRDTVKSCVSAVRAGRSFTQFDAYVTGEYGESVRWFGTPSENFQFEKCMAERGIPLTAKSDDAAAGNKK